MTYVHPVGRRRSIRSFLRLLRAFSLTVPAVALAALAAGACSPPALAPDASHGDAGVPDASDDPLPDAGVVALRGEPVALGPLAGGRTGPLAITPTALVVVTPAGVLRSRDRGAAWEWASAPSDCATSPIDWMAAVEGALVAHCADRLWASTDDGTSWTATSDAGATHGPFTANATTAFAIDATGEVVRWRADAPSWTGLAPFEVSLGHEVRSLGADDGTVYAFTSRTGARLDLTTPGPTWESEGLAAYGRLHVSFGDAGGHATIENGAPATLARRDETGTWVEIGAADAARFGLDVVDLWMTEGRMLVASHGGLFASYDGGETFTREIDAPFVSTDAIARDGVGLFAASGAGLWRESDGGWERLAVFGEPIRSVHAGEGWVLATARDEDGFVRGMHSTPAGWERTDPIDWFVEPVALGDEVLIVSGYAVWASSDGGRTFAQRSEGSTFSFDFLAAVGSELVGAGYSSTEGGSRWVRSTDGGRVWSDYASYPCCGSHARLVTLDDVWLLEGLDFRSGQRSIDAGRTWEPLGSERLWSLTESSGAVLAAREGGGVARSTDRGASWAVVALAELPVSAVVARGDLVIAGVGALGRLDAGLHYSLDGGGTWQPLDAVFPGLAGAPRVSALSLAGDTLVVGTFGAGVWSVLLASQ